MVRAVGRLSALKVSKAREPGMYADGGGLYLQVMPSGSRSWVFRYMLNGRSREMGLGSLELVPLAAAREKAAECRRQKQDGIDPIEARRELRVAARLAAASALSFKACSEAYIDAHKASWRNAKHADQWRNTLDTYAWPVFGSLPVQSIDTPLVLKVLEPIWKTKTETASRLRGRIEAILDWATARGYRRGDNPARWRGHLQNLLPKRDRVQRVKHHPALPYDELGAFMLHLRKQEGIAAAALEFLILTATRTSETIGARWKEIDLDKGLWTIPAHRIKSHREHRIPLSAPALAILRRMRSAQQQDSSELGEFVFPGAKVGKPLSNMAMLQLLARMQRGDLTVHGFRSTFRDWAAECTNYPREAAEMALAHAVSDKVEAAYRRGDLFEKRRRLMAEWAKFCNSAKPAGVVVSLQGRRVRAPSKA